MGTEELLIVLMIGAVLLIGPLMALVLSIIAFYRTRKIRELSHRVAELESRLSATNVAPSVAGFEVKTPVEEGAIPQLAGQADGAAEVVTASLVQESVTSAGAMPAEDRIQQGAAPSGAPMKWETFIGQKAFGWLAVLLFVLTATFFLRYAYQNNWIGPVGRVAIGELVGAALIGAGWRHFQRGWKRFSSMLTAAGIVVLYLSTFAAFGFYRLLPQQHAGVFLAVLVLESMIAAVCYRSAVVALVAVIGGLLTPWLMQSDHDTYPALFIYLTVLNTGVVAAQLARRWAAVGSVAFLGTQGLFWLWYFGNYHPEKFAWALGFQAILFGLYLSYSTIASFISTRVTGWEELARFVLNAIFGFIALRVLLKDDYGIWLGSVAMGMATLYAVTARSTLASRPRDQRLLLTSLAVSVGFIAWAFPVQANARWVSFGWAAMGAALWWFGLRVSSPSLRAMAAALAAAANMRLLMFDLPTYTRDPFIPLFNRFALPSLGVVACILASVISVDSFLKRMKPMERFGVAVAGVSGVLLLWLILSVECYGYFDSQTIGSDDVSVWRWRGQLALTVLWTVYATALLVLGFQLARARLRWLAMALYGVSVVKLFLVDMANVQQLYRILAFFVLAVVLGLVARAYQRFK